MVAGEVGDVVPLVRDVLAELGPSYRSFGEARLIDAVVAGVPGLVSLAPFLWMETCSPVGGPCPGPDVRWLDTAAEHEARPLFDLSFPHSHAQPGRVGVRRWAGVRDVDGGLLAVAADAWSGVGCGLLGGVVVHPGARGRGLGAAVSRFVVEALVRDYGRAALVVDADNVPAIVAYERIGMRGVLFGAAAVSRPT
ncbi:GNAT family N-acetyltransferase [Streptomyces sp. GQFP]|uniref:GNAT family N-acetyltransferase n=1 Tax=Streptomyces sp. GQFP TaxID=2907545 RepID=UPI001F17D0BF|nr:GNAT family N-acetyltransferase [Streptomyces sp. GQFP]UIX31784.1 GNAT family N-acetyltransferase [Streptomyces sp. GQFP]